MNINNNLTFFSAVTICIILGMIVGLIISCSSSTPVANVKPTPIVATATPLVGTGRYQIPNRYIDWSAYVVCWYLEDAIDCMPIKDTKLLGGQ